MLSAEDLPFRSKIADYIVNNAILEHLPREKNAILELSRVCKAKSEIMITVPLKLRYILPFFWLPNYIHDKRIGHLRRYDEKLISDRFYKFKFKIKKIYYSGHSEKSFVVALATIGVNNKKWDEWCEDCDRKKKHKKYGANIICIILKR